MNSLEVQHFEIENWFLVEKWNKLKYLFGRMDWRTKENYSTFCVWTQFESGLSITRSRIDQDCVLSQATPDDWRQYFQNSGTRQRTPRGNNFLPEILCFQNNFKQVTKTVCKNSTQNKHFFARKHFAKQKIKSTESWQNNFIFP